MQRATAAPLTDAYSATTKQMIRGTKDCLRFIDARSTHSSRQIRARGSQVGKPVVRLDHAARCFTPAAPRIFVNDFVELRRKAKHLRNRSHAGECSSGRG